MFHQVANVGYTYLQQACWSCCYVRFKDAGGHSISWNTMQMLGMKVSHPFPFFFHRTHERASVRAHA